MDDFLNIAKGVLGVVAPTIATALLGPLGGQAATALCTALGLAPTAKSAEIAAALQGATPEQLQAVKLAEIKFQSDMKALDVDIERINAGDRDSARRMQIATTSWIPGVLAMLMTGGFFGMLTILSFVEVPAASAPLLNGLTGSLGTAWVAVVMFYFGSNAGSAAKTQMLYNSVPAPAVSMTATSPGRSPHASL